MSDETVPVCDCGTVMERQIAVVNFSFKGGPPTRKFHA